MCELYRGITISGRGQQLRCQQLTFGVWLFRIARNEAVDFHRRHRVTVPWDLVPEALQPVASRRSKVA